MERERVKEPDPEQLSDYDKGRRRYQEWADRMKSGLLHIPAAMRPVQKTRQGFIRYFMNVVFTDTALNSWAVFEQHIKMQSGRHNHQGGIIIYVIEGTGITEANGLLLEWKAGDLLLLPIQPGGCTHQHWNADASKGCRWIAFRDLLVAQYLGAVLEQVSEMPDVRTNPKGDVVKDWKTRVSGEQIPLVTHPDELAGLNVFDRTMALRDLQRRRQEQGTWLIRGEELPWELNAHGKMQWYLNPCLAYTSVQTHIFYRQEIAPGSRSGVQRHGGEKVFYILEGEGYTEVNGVRHAWKGGDVMTLPMFPEGVVYRHVNTGPGRVQLLGIERNFVHTTGVDRQSGFEQLQPCPEYRDARGS
jgi:quercetin dioxygenase-like cupin family protein